MGCTFLLAKYRMIYILRQLKCTSSDRHRKGYASLMAEKPQYKTRMEVLCERAFHDKILTELQNYTLLKRSKTKFCNFTKMNTSCIFSFLNQLTSNYDSGSFLLTIL